MEKDQIIENLTQKVHEYEQIIKDIGNPNENLEEFRNLKIENNQYLLDNILLSMPSKKELYKLNKEFNGYGIIINKFIQEDSEGNYHLKFEILWVNEKIQNVNKGDIFINIEKKNGNLILTNNECIEIVLVYDISLKLNLDNINYDYLELQDNIKKQKNAEKLEQLQKYCTFKKNTHNLASIRYNDKNLCLVLPSILITAISGICSFLASSSEFNQETGIWLSIAVGIMASISTFLQSFSSAMNYNGRKEGHSIATEDYDNVLVLLDFELNNPKESLQDPEAFYDKIKKDIVLIKQKCKYQVPDDINKLYSYDQISSYMQKVKGDLLKDAVELKAEKARNSLKLIEDYKDIDIPSLNKNFKLKSNSKNDTQDLENIIIV